MGTAFRRAAVALAASYGLVSCNGDGPVGPPPAPVVASISVTPDADTLVALGRTRTFVAVARDSEGVAIPGVALRWSSSDTLIARVDSLTGLVTAVANGEVTIQARAGTITGTAQAAVIQFVASVQVTPGTVALNAIGGTQAYAAVARDSNNAVVAGVRFLWGSSNPTVAQLDTLGVAQILGPGTTTISATGRGIPAYAELTVSQEATQLAFSIGPQSLAAGAPFSTAIEVEVRDANGAIVRDARIPVTLSLASNPQTASLLGTPTVNTVGGIATFSGNSLVRAGSYNLIATAGALVADTSEKFDVLAGPPDRATLQMVSAGGNEVGSTSTLDLQLVDAFGNPVAAELDFLPGLRATSERGFPTVVRYLDITNLGAGRYRYTDVHFRTPVGRLTVQAQAQIVGRLLPSDELPFTANATISAVAVGDEYICAMAALGPLCWGDNETLEISQFTFLEDSVPSQPDYGSFPSAFVQIVARQQGPCALTNVGSVHCWGAFSQQVLEGTGPGGIVFVALTSGLNHTCGRTAGGAVYCWGTGTSGELGHGAFASSPDIPVHVQGSGSGALIFESIDAGGTHTCGVTTLGAGYCWGSNNGAQLGDSTTTGRNVPTLVAGSGSGSRVLSRISASTRELTCAITVAAELLCWGSGYLGMGTNLSELGQTGQRLVPTPAVNLAGFSSGPWLDISLGDSHACGVRGGRLYCWGEHHALSGPPMGSTLERAPLMIDVAGRGVLSVETGRNSTCARNVNGLYCFGSNRRGMLGIGSTARGAVEIPTRVIH